MKKSIMTTILVFLFSFQINAQEHTTESVSKHNDGCGFRIAGIIGHTLIKNVGRDNDVFVPSWGLDLEYWFNHTWGVGLHNDIEIETFIIKNSDNEEVERVNPLVLTLDALYHVSNGFVLTIGPGVEIEADESFYLTRLGVEYEKQIGNTFYLVPTLFLDQRFDGFSTWTFGLGIGKHL